MFAAFLVMTTNEPLQGFETPTPADLFEPPGIWSALFRDLFLMLRVSAILCVACCLRRILPGSREN